MDELVGEVPLPRGNSGRSVVRVGATVRRPHEPATSSVNALLIHFATLGLEGVPRVLGSDEQGRQMLTYVEGYVDPDPKDLDLETLAHVGQLIRALHDGAASFVAPPDATWNVLIAPDEEVLICHHDLAPWNLVRGSEGLAFIDWDGAGPGSRLWDLAYAAHGFVPLSPRALPSLDDAARRLSALVAGYELSALERERLVSLLAPRTRSMYELLRVSALNDHDPWATLYREGHGAAWLEDANFIGDHDAHWRQALLVAPLE